MKIKFGWLILTFLVSGLSYGQKDDRPLLTVDGDPIMTSEFLRVYNKNLDLVKDESQKDVDGYLKLFTEYQLKLKEARRLKLHEDEKYKREFNRYKKQLTKNYLSENKVTDDLVEEAYDRNALDINASHVLVRLDAGAKDTLEAYNKVLELKERVLKEGFNNVKKDVHDGKKIFLEDLGYFSVFKMVYDFETAAYNTPVGEISEPFRTQFGYHVVQVNDRRPSRGTITAAHIMISTNQKDTLIDPEKRINTIYQKFLQGENFESLAKQFSDDKSSAKNGGRLSEFKSGQLSSTVFEDMAFSLENDGDVSKPFKSAYGWHIVKRLKLQSIQSFEELKPSLEASVKRDTRSKLINTAMVKELKERYNIVYNTKAKSYFESILSQDFYTRKWELPEDFKKEEKVFTINGSVYTYDDFGRHLNFAQRIYTNQSIPFTTIIEKEFDKFFEKTILKYREENLELENEEFANIIKEYRDGLLLFDLMEKEIWNKASKDSLGLERYYNANTANYQWKDRVEVSMASVAEKSVAAKVLELMKEGKTNVEITELINGNKIQTVLFTNKTFDIGDAKLPSDLEVKEGLSSKIYAHNGAFHIIDIKSVLPAGSKTLEEAKGSVISDYQEDIEKNWIESLYNRFEIKVDKKALKAVKKIINKS
ncbi:MAG: peptidylprolyl isomerase [Winogradskyella sp.]|uniref:peptidylprolyl isomerase n=1 Tax=Winogradskyella sp. TaxID=1883156 RepID=UPI0025DF2CC2|nr:peptidylprolyl isomerase [Winogradskyella sp.]NRB58705.1 peptidylprolyl isomerase [Winogradskyella sp.]